MAVAGGRAFTFTYTDTLDALAAAGVEVVPFDPLRDQRLPSDVDGLLVGGGFPETYAAELSDNRTLLADVRRRVTGGLPTWAECGGLTWLCRELDGHPMAAVIDAAATMGDRLHLGYRTAPPPAATPLGPAGTELRGHEFHYSTVDPPGDALHLQGRFASHPDGHATPTLVATYLHHHPGGDPSIVANFVAACAARAPVERLSGWPVHPTPDAANVCRLVTPGHAPARRPPTERGPVPSARTRERVSRVTRLFDAAVANVGPLVTEALVEATVLHDRLTKPRGALGRLEPLGIRLAGIAGVCPPPVPVPGGGGRLRRRPRGAGPGRLPVAPGGDGPDGGQLPRRRGGHQRHRPPDGGRRWWWSTWASPRRSTTHRACSGARSDEGRPTSPPRPAMSADEARDALDVGAEVAADLVAGGAKCLVTGEMGIGNTTAAAALIAALTGRPPAEVTGRGTGIDDATLAHKVAVVEAALARHAVAIAAGPLRHPGRPRGTGDRGPGRLHRGRGRGPGAGRDRRRHRRRRPARGHPPRPRACSRSASPATARRSRAPPPCSPTSASNRSSTSACAWARGVAPASPCPVVEAAARVLREMATFDSAGVSEK